jgi:uncharacterized damage-inducible protein DinB
MDPLAQAIINRLEAVHRELVEIIEGSSYEAVHWTPGAGMNTMSVLAVHVAGAERYWIGDVAVWEPSGRIRSQEFSESELEPAMLIDRLNSSLNYAEQVLSNFAPDDWSKVRVSSQDNKEYTAVWAVLHALEHTAVHLGHMQLTRQLWEIKNAT